MVPTSAVTINPAGDLTKEASSSQHLGIPVPIFIISWVPKGNIISTTV
jgi:hypothetical protein